MSTDGRMTATALHLQTLGHTISLLTKDAAIIGAGLAPVIW
jgi:hypothetical protein